MSRPAFPSASWFLIPLIVSVATGTGASGQASCPPQWTQGVSGLRGTDGEIVASAVFDDGSGPALYIGGVFTSAGAGPAERIARWNGSAWSALGLGTDSTVMALAVHDDGTGPALYAGGVFSTAGGVPASGIARWNGTSWSAVGGGMNGAVQALAVHDEGAGPRLFAAGDFTVAGGVSANRIARWDGTSWSALQSGFGAPALSLLSFDDGTGPALYAGGFFFNAGQATVSGIARWRASGWYAVGGGTDQAVRALAVFDDGNGPDLYAGGGFTTAGGVPANRVARWNGVSWSAVGNGLGATSQDRVSALTAHDDGTGPALYAGGVNMVVASRWNGSAWQQLPFLGPVSTFARFDDGGGLKLHAGGNFSYAPGNHISQWDGASWSFPGPGPGGFVTALAAFDDGGGNKLYAGGEFGLPGSLVTTRVVAWNGGSWAPVGAGFGAPPSVSLSDLAVFDDGSGPRLFAAGAIPIPAFPAGGGVVRWDGTSWTPPGGGILGWVRAIEVYDDGTGPGLYAVGGFLLAGGNPVVNIARWNGVNWSPVSTGISGTVTCMATHDDGTGPALYVGGNFFTAGGVTVTRIARWNGFVWAPVGSLLPVQRLVSLDTGTGPVLYALVSSGASYSVYQWDSTQWIPTISSQPSVFVNVLAAHDDGSGPALYGAGRFGFGYVPPQLARYVGGQWMPLAGALGENLPANPFSLWALSSADLGAGPALFVGGAFSTAGGLPSAGIAEWRAPRPAIYLSQPGGAGTGGYVANSGLVAGIEYFNILSLDPCPGAPGGGPYLGLCSTTVSTLIDQVFQPLGAIPFHFLAAGPTTSFGPYAVPAGLTVEAICFDVAGSSIGCVSPVRRYVTY